MKTVPRSLQIPLNIADKAFGLQSHRVHRASAVTTTTMRPAQVQAVMYHGLTPQFQVGLALTDTVRELHLCDGHRLPAEEAPTGLLGEDAELHFPDLGFGQFSFAHPIASSIR
jgi:hypothetical protein